MRLPRDQYEAAVERMRASGLGDVRDEEIVHSSAPFRSASLDRIVAPEEALELARQLAELALAIQGHLTVSARADGCYLDLMVTRAMSREEILQAAARRAPA